ncbi:MULTISPECIES: BT_3044 domain-containing protein [Proteiniphilum]|mgnify:FL=1|jgi:hypothetical protein|uniref:BT_3044 domain-containing protein n=1 Tax=Proteiniphilum TaxID=294702 RepID=UPI001EEAE3EB|nr:MULTISPECIES: DUF4361 domain-containing protein [Proteiniphilum]ULB33472.1 DUF4361 domain-containing protein [Proteiniphilum propionicum]
MNRSIILLVVVVLFSCYSCNNDDIFEKEQYKTIFALQSEGTYNIFEGVHDLNEPESYGYIAATCGGTLPSEKEIKVKLLPDLEAYNRYNMLNFDVDRKNYARLLPEKMYDIDDYSLTIPVGERNGRMKIAIRPEGLSPDSTYFIPIKVDSYSSYEINHKKSNVLYRVLLKNDYATQKPQTNYTMRAFRGSVQLPGIKTMHPVSRNKVRILADNIAFQPDTEVINKYGIILEIGDDGNIIISPYKDLRLTQINGDINFPNMFFIEETPFKNYKVFLIRYNYINDAGNTIEMKEELRLEFAGE